MKKTLTLFALIAVAFPLAAQEFITLHLAGGEPLNGTTLVHYGDADAVVMEQPVYVTLASGADRNVNVRRYEVDVQPGTLNYFCWGVCYLEQEAGVLPVWQAQQQHALMLSEGVTEFAFKGYHVPMGILGTSTYRYVWFDTASATDSVWMDIQFVSTPVGIDDRTSALRTFSIFPNPSMGNDVLMTVDLDGSVEGVSVLLYNTLGEQVRAITLTALRSRNVLPTSGLPSGIYFATVQRHGKVLATKRVVIANGR